MPVIPSTYKVQMNKLADASEQLDLAIAALFHAWESGSDSLVQYDLWERLCKADMVLHQGIENLNGRSLNDVEIGFEVGFHSGIRYAVMNNLEGPEGKQVRAK